MKLDTFTRAFFETALWSSNDYSREDGGDPLDENHSIADIAPETLEGLAEECARFQVENAETLEACYGTVVHHGKAPGVLSSTLCDEAQAGRDFWLTRCGHGCVIAR